MGFRLSTDSEFINKLSNVIEANLADEDFGVEELAHKIGISRSQIHRRLKSINNQSVSQFIRESRLNKARDMLLNDAGTVSEIAYQVGFGSPSYFNKCFHDYFGYSPGEAKKHVFENIENKMTNNNSEFKPIKGASDNSGITIKNSSTSFFKKLLFGFIGVLIIIALSVFTNYYFFDLSTSEDASHIITDKSIAVFPLKNLSNDIEIQHLAGGLMEDILTRLSHIHDFDVRSRISAESYEEVSMSVPEIARQLGVSYIVTGSIMKNGDSVRVYIKLIEATNDKTIWDDQYDGDLTNIFAFISKVSEQIANILEIVLSPEERKQLNKLYTQDIEVYNLYLLGRHFWHRRTEEDTNISIKYFNQALAIDQKYSLAYAGLADAYIILAWHGWHPETKAIAKSKEFARKALSIDKNLAEAHATLGCIATYYEWNWDEAEKELKRAIKLNPNYATAHQFYAEYLDVIRKKDEARKQINRALELDPLSLQMHYLSYRYYFKEGKYNEAIEEINKINELQKDTRNPIWNNFRMAMNQSQDLKAIDALMKGYENRLGKDSVNLISIYEESGIEGVIHWHIDSVLLTRKNIDNYVIAMQYAWLKDKNSTLEYLERAFEVRQRCLPWMNSDPMFDFLRTEPRFIAILKKMGLEDY